MYIVHYTDCHRFFSIDNSYLCTRNICVVAVSLVLLFSSLGFCFTAEFSEWVSENAWISEWENEIVCAWRRKRRLYIYIYILRDRERESVFAHLLKLKRTECDWNHFHFSAYFEIKIRVYQQTSRSKVGRESFPHQKFGSKDF